MRTGPNMAVRLVKRVSILNLWIVLARNGKHANPISGDKSILQHGLQFFRKNLSLLFDLQIMDHFKRRFR